MVRTKAFAIKSALGGPPALEQAWSRAAITAIKASRDGDLQLLQAQRQACRGGRPAPLNELPWETIEGSLKGDTTLLGLALLLGAEQAALWLVDCAVADRPEAAEQQQAAAAAEAGSESEADWEEEPGRSWLYAHAFFLDPYPEGVQDGTAWPDFEESPESSLKSEVELEAQVRCAHLLCPAVLVWSPNWCMWVQPVLRPACRFP